MKNPFNFFEAIFLINLDDRPEKWEDSQVELEKVGILDRTERFAAYKTNPGAIGCAKSNIECIKIAKERGLNNVLILEDDIEFEDNCIEILEKSLEQLFQIEKVGMFYLGINPLTNFPKVTKNLAKIIAGYTTHAYCVFPNMYDIIINEGKPPIDVYYSQLHRRLNNSYCTYPLIGSQRKCWSDIENVECDNGAHIKERFYKYVN